MSTSMDPYAPPESRPSSTSDARRPHFPQSPFARSAWLLLLAFGVSFLTMVLASLFDGHSSPILRPLITIGLTLATALSGIGTFFGAQGLFVPGTGLARPTGWTRVGSLGFAVANGFVTFVTGFMAAWASSGFHRGRQLRRFGRVQLPPVESGPAWATVAVGAFPDEDEARVTADQWRHNGRTEHASVAAFAALTADLMALGAPPALVASANLDALDEIRHTELCFSLARALDGRSESPGPFPAAHPALRFPLGRTLALARLAADSLVDGALHEGVSARVLAKLARRCHVPAVSAVLKELSRDEGKHAAHGWDVVLWCVRAAQGEGQDEVILDALVAALEGLPEVMLSPLPADAAHGFWERFGIQGHALEATEYAATLADLRRRVGELRALPSSRKEMLREAC